MKSPTVFLGEMTNPEVEAFLAAHPDSPTVIVPVGSTEQHGPHGPLLTDAIIAEEVARRVAPRVGAVVAPRINYSLSYPHAGFTGVAYVRIPTFMALIEDLCAMFASVGFQRIAFFNGHFDNTYAIAYACANAAPRLPAGTRAFPVDVIPPEFMNATDGLHANRGETSAVIAIDPALVDMDLANAEMPPFPETSSGVAAHTAFFFSTPGSVHRATLSGTWGDAREASAEFGERYLTVATDSAVRLLDDIDRTFQAMPPR
jgi:creatinine amidohydrolase